VGLTPDDLRELLAAFEESTWQEMTVTVSGDSLSVSRRADSRSTTDGAATGGTPGAGGNAPSLGRPPVPAASPEPPPAVPAPAELAADPASAVSGIPVPAPSVGLFWHAPSPGAAPFVEVGARVGPEDVVGIVEVMKLMNRVPAGVAGVVSAVLVENGGMVEHGQPLVLIDAAA
jgi:acetyl-CoA carboxylase biotin carboxyl carrier protein